jgi:hypothetical protein
MIMMALASVGKVCPWVLVGGAGGVLAAVQGWDSGVIVAAVGGVGMAVLGLIFEYRRRRFEADKLEAQARIDAIQLEAVAKAAALKVEAEAKVAREKLALEAQIALDQMREKSYAGTLTEQIAKLQKATDDGNARVEEANRKLHKLSNEAQTAALSFYEERQTLTKQLDDLRRDYADLLMRMESNIKVNARKTAVHDGQIAELQQVASGDSIPALGVARLVATEKNTKAVEADVVATDKNTASTDINNRLLRESAKRSPEPPK